VINGKTKAEFNTQEAGEYPRLEEHKKKRKIEMKEIKEIAKKVAYAAAKDETRVVLTGIRVEKKGEGERVVATDGFRLSIKEIKKGFLGKDALGVNIPARLFNELDKHAGEEKDIFFEIEKEGKSIIVSWNGALINAQLIGGEFPDFERIVPKDFNTRVIIDKEDLERAIKTAAVFARESSSIIRLLVKKNKILVSANSPQAGKSKSEVLARVQGEEKKMAFNYRFLLDFLKSADGEEIIFEMTDPLKPGVFKVKNDPSYLHIIMPVRVQEEKQG
jgi:DNA polymerase-3 subunit beta